MIELILLISTSSSIFLGLLTTYIRKRYKKYIKTKEKENFLIENFLEYKKNKLYRYVKNKKKSIKVLNEKSKRANEECVICYENYKKNNFQVKLLCKHKYHVLCLSEWVDEKKKEKNTITCPLCNLPLKRKR